MSINAITANYPEKFSPTVEVWGTADEILEGLPLVIDKHDYTIIDGPAGISELTRAILLRADLALVPVRTYRFRYSQRSRCREINKAGSVCSWRCP